MARFVAKKGKIMSTEKVYQQQLNTLIYVLEDDKDIIVLLDHLFKLNGFVDYVFFYDTDKFVSSLNEHVHISLIDYKLDGPMDGIEVMNVVRSRNPWCKVIMISGQQDPKIITEFFHKGGFRYAYKGSPEYNKDLVNYMQEAIGLIKNQIDVQEEFKSVYDDLKKQREKSETRTDQKHN